VRRLRPQQLVVEYLDPVELLDVGTQPVRQIQGGAGVHPMPRRRSVACRVGAATLPVPGWREPIPALPVVVDQRVEQRCFCLVHAIADSR
jgi:hypothetical protein